MVLDSYPIPINLDTSNNLKHVDMAAGPSGVRVTVDVPNTSQYYVTTDKTILAIGADTATTNMHMLLDGMTGIALTMGAIISRENYERTLSFLAKIPESVYKDSVNEVLIRSQVGLSFSDSQLRVHPVLNRALPLFSMDMHSRVDKRNFSPTNTTQTVFEREQDLLIPYLDREEIGLMVIGQARQRLTIPDEFNDIFHGICDVCLDNSLTTLTDSQLRDVFTLEWWFDPA